LQAGVKTDQPLIFNKEDISSDEIEVIFKIKEEILS